MSATVSEARLRQEGVSGDGRQQRVDPGYAEVRPPFYVTRERERELRLCAGRLSPSLTVDQATSFDEYARQLMVPPAVMDLVRKASSIRLASWEVEGIRAELEPQLEPQSGGLPGLLRMILKWKAYGYPAEDAYSAAYSAADITDQKLRIKGDRSHPPYIRVACTGKGDFDELGRKYLEHKYQSSVGARGAVGDSRHTGDYGSPVVLEIWPAQHYSPIHSHGGTTGIIYGLAGQVDVMVYDDLDWDAEKLGLVTLTPGQCAWLADDQHAVHKVYCPMDGGQTPLGPNNPLNATSEFAATFHVYLNRNEVMSGGYTPTQLDSREVFKLVNENHPHERQKFTTYSDLSWSTLLQILAAFRPTP